MGWVFLASVRPDSPSRSDAFFLLPVAARLRRGSRVEPYVVRQARTTTRVFFTQQRQSSNALLRRPFAEAGASTCQATSQSNCAGRILDSTTKEEEE